MVRPLPPRDPSFDSTGNHYWRYHGLDALLACKRPVTDSCDEDLFIAVHQICELAFHQMILDLERALAALRVAASVPPGELAADTGEARYFLHRVVRLYHTVNGTMPILGTMRAFAEFRTALGPSSGFQSVQFRRLEILSGVPRAYWRGGTADAEGRLHPAEVELERRFGGELAAFLEEHRGHNLRVYFELLRDRCEGATDGDRARSLAADPRARALCEELLAYDRAQLRFHKAHLRLAVEQLERVGVEVGTGGTSFRSYLARYERELAPLFAGLDSGEPR